LAFSELYSPRIGRVRKIQPSFFVAASLAAQGTGNRGTMMLQKVQYYWANAEERRIYVQRLHIEGEKLAEMARTLGVHVETIRRDFKHLGLETWSSIDDYNLCVAILDIIRISHAAVGWHTSPAGASESKSAASKRPW
jgi:hypothetical protein